MDVNGDGLPDLVTTLAHDYGIFWYEQKKDSQGNRAWVKHTIDNAWSQAHAFTIADLKGDGNPVLVTGKRYYAHEHDRARTSRWASTGMSASTTSTGWNGGATPSTTVLAPEAACRSDRRR